ncbi:hypothetical protein HJFPF1_13519 [Paramyrothecium foliicola]|nr:hypothetical protein HJFPF1_13519 [Paramyrothecium foliicola]
MSTSSASHHFVLLRNPLELNSIETLRVTDQTSAGHGSDSEGLSHAESGVPAVAPRRKATRPGKEKKNKNKKKQKKQSSQPPVNEPQDKEVPPETYRIVEDFESADGNGAGLVTDYLLAVYELFQNIAFARADVQSFWQEVAYDGLNSAVAGALSNVAIKTVQNSDGQIFIDFPGNDSYNAVDNTIIRGDRDKFRENFRLVLRGGASGKAEKLQDAYLDVEEQFLFYTYRDLRDFILDFQMNRTGKPTKRMAAELKDWKPDLDLRKITKEERIRWRRA